MNTFAHAPAPITSTTLDVQVPSDVALEVLRMRLALPLDESFSPSLRMTVMGAMAQLSSEALASAKQIGFGLDAPAGSGSIVITVGEPGGPGLVHVVNVSEKTIVWTETVNEETSVWDHYAGADCRQTQRSAPTTLDGLAFVLQVITA